MKFILTLAAVLVSSLSMATHLVGGELAYTQVGESTYLVELIVYRDCDYVNGNVNGTDFDDEVYIGVWDGFGFINLTDVVVADIDNSSIVQLDSDESAVYDCLDVSNVCVEKASYFVTISLPPSMYGYDLVWQRCCRSPVLSNIENVGGMGLTGMTVKTHIPGENEGVSNGANSTPEWSEQIPTAACVLQSFTWDFGGQDADDDSLSYVLCPPLSGGDAGSPTPNPPSTPPYGEIPFADGFGPLSPLPVQDSVTLDANTGVLSFTPTTPGSYAMGICVNEFRSGELINTVVRDILIKVTLCDQICDESGNCLNDMDGDGVCDEIEVSGCTALEACNYNASATEDDGTCLWYDAIGDCGGGCWEASPVSPTVCSGAEVYGCTNPEACNYNPTANIDDGGCLWPVVGFDCEGSSLCGVPSLSTLTVEVVEDAWEGRDLYRLYIDLPPIENTYVGAVAADQQLAFPFAPQRLAVSINAPEGVFNSSFNTTWSAQGLSAAFVSLFPELAFDSYATIGLSGPAAESLVPNATNPSFIGDPPTTNEFNDFFGNSGATNLNMNDGAYYIFPTAFNQGLADEQGRCLIGQITTSGSLQGQLIVLILQADGLGGTNTEEVEIVRFLFRDAGVFQGFKPESGSSDISQLAEIPVCGCNDPSAGNFIPWVEIGVDACEYVCLTDIDNNGTCDDQEVYGCGYELAENYNPEVTRDDGSCIFPNPDDEGCGLVYDGSGDGAVGSSDLLGLLVEFGQSCED